MEKYMVPSIPNTQLILEDLCGLNDIPTSCKPMKSQDGNDELQNAQGCYLNFRKLQGDLLQQDSLNSKLDELNKKLVENIASMKQ